MKKTFWIGLFIISVFIFFILGILFIQDVNIRNSNYSFTVIFEDVQGLYDGDDVNVPNTNQNFIFREFDD